MDHSDKPAGVAKSQGIGARVPRKEDARHLAGKGNFVGDMAMPGLCEVAFLRSPLAHARIGAVTIAPEIADRVFVREMMPEARDIVADSTLPSYRVSAQPPLAHGKVRFVGEPVVMAFASTRAQAEDLIEMVEVEYDELPVYADVTQAQAATADLVHEQWEDNVFVTLHADRDFESLAAGAEVVVKRTIDLSRQCMVPMEGKAVLAYWDHQADQLVLISATQVPHLIRTGISLFLGLEEGQVRIISPDVGGGFGYKGILQQEELCVAWLALTHRRPFRCLEDRREHLIAGANCREHHYEITAYADRRGKLLALDCEITIDCGAYSVWPFSVGLEPGAGGRHPAGPLRVPRLSLPDVIRGDQQAGILPYRGVARTGVCFAIELTMDAIAREVGREPWEVRLENLVQPEQMPYDNVTNKHFDSGDYPASAAPRDGDDRHRRGARAPGARRGRWPPASASASPSIPSSPRTAPRSSPTWGIADGARARPGDGADRRRTAGWSCGSASTRTDRAWRRRSPRSRNEILGIDVARIKLVHGDTGPDAVLHRHLGVAFAGDVRRRGGSRPASALAAAPAAYRRAPARRRPGDGSAVRRAPVLRRAVGGDRAKSPMPGICTPQRLPSDVDPAGLEVTLGYKPQGATPAPSAMPARQQWSRSTPIPAPSRSSTTSWSKTAACSSIRWWSKARSSAASRRASAPRCTKRCPTTRTASRWRRRWPTTCCRARPKCPTFGSSTSRRRRRIRSSAPRAWARAARSRRRRCIFNAVNDALRKIGAAEVLETPLTPRRLLAAIADSAGAARARCEERT